MIDFHAHILPNIDDGSRSIDETFNLIKEAQNVGFDEIVLTPHYKETVFETDVAERGVWLDAITKNLTTKNIKAKLYNQAVTNVMQKVGMPVKNKLINQFVSPKTYYNYLKHEVIVVKDLTFVQKGEEQYLAIVCSMILSKYAYLQYFTNMSRSLKMNLPHGNSASVDAIAVEIAKKYGPKMLNKVTKTNMTNYKRIKNLIG